MLNEIYLKENLKKKKFFLIKNWVDIKGFFMTNNKLIDSLSCPY